MKRKPTLCDKCGIELPEEEKSKWRKILFSKLKPCIVGSGKNGYNYRISTRFFCLSCYKKFLAWVNEK